MHLEFKENKGEGKQQDALIFFMVGLNLYLRSCGLFLNMPLEEAWILKFSISDLLRVVSIPLRYLGLIWKSKIKC